MVEPDYKNNKYINIVYELCTIDDNFILSRVNEYICTMISREMTVSKKSRILGGKYMEALCGHRVGVIHINGPMRATMRTRNERPSGVGFGHSRIDNWHDKTMSHRHNVISKCSIYRHCSRLVHKTMCHCLGIAEGKGTRPIPSESWNLFGFVCPSHPNNPPFLPHLN